MSTLPMWINFLRAVTTDTDKSGGNLVVRRGKLINIEGRGVTRT